MKCESCNAEHDGSFASGRFCSKSCSSSFSTANATNRKAKISEALSGRKTGRKTNQWTNEQRVAAANRRRQQAQDLWKLSDWALVPVSRRRDRLMLEQNGKCAICEMVPTWNGKALVFQLDHVSGDRKDESRINMRLVCPNCHSQTDTWCSKNASPEGKQKMLACLAKGRESQKKYC